MQTNEGHSILIITESPPESFNPASERLFRMALASGSVFERVILLSLRGFEAQNQRRRIERNESSRVSLYVVNFVRALPYPLSALFDPVKFLVFFMHGFMLCRRYKFSCVVASMPPLETGASAWFLRKLFRVKLLIDLMDDWESVLASQLTQYVPIRLVTPLFRLSNAIYSSSDSIFVVTNTLAKKVQARKIKAELILTPNGANTSLFYPRNEENRKKIRLRRGLPVSKIILTYSGSGGNPYYRLDIVLSSIKSLPDDIKDKIFLVLYLYDAIEHYDKMKNQLKLASDLVQVRKAIPRNSLAEVLAACDIGLVPFDDKPYLQYATSTKLYEYLSAGLYVVASGSKDGELNSIISSDSELGLFVSPNAQEFVHAFELIILKGKDLFKDVPRFVRNEFIRQNYDWKENMAKAIRTLSTNLLD